MKVNANITIAHHENSNVRAYATVTIGDCFAIHSIKILQGAKGLFVSMPSHKSKKDDEYRDICHPVTVEFRKQLNKVILDGYQKELKKVCNAEEAFQQGDELA